MGWLRGTVPTARAAALLAGVGVLAFLVPVWLAVALGLAWLVAVLVDAATVRTPPRLSRELASTLSRGAPTPVVLRVEADDGRRTSVRQPPAPGVGVDQTGKLAVPALRGRHLLPGVACASHGPLGLATVHHPPGPATELRVLPDLIGARRLVLALRRSRDGLPSGLARGPLGLGTEFESVRESTLDDDVRTLNWRATARLGRPMSNQYRIERDRDVVCLLDAGRLSAAWLGDRSVLDVELDVLTVLGLAADELGDRFGVVAFDAQVHRFLRPRHRAGRTAVEALFDLQAQGVDSDVEAAAARVTRLRRAFVVVLTDLVDPAAARSLQAAVGTLTRRHAVLVAAPEDPALTRWAEDSSDPARELAARDVLDARYEAVLGLRRAGAEVIEAAPGALPGRCLDAYVRAKRRARL